MALFNKAVEKIDSPREDWQYCPNTQVGMRKR